MSPEQVKQVLLSYRPGGMDDDAPELAAALELARRDAALGEWFAAHCAAQDNIRQGFRAVAVPAGLREQIISERPMLSRPVSLKNVLVGALAVVVLLAGVSFTMKLLRERDAISFAAYRRQMVLLTTDSYGMNLVTNDIRAVNSYLAKVKAPADYTMPEHLKKLGIQGCMKTIWSEHTVSLVCLTTATNAPAGAYGDVWLFVTDRQVAANAPTSATPKYKTVSEMGTASWSSKEYTYLLVAKGGRTTVEDLLGEKLD